MRFATVTLTAYNPYSRARLVAEVRFDDTPTPHTLLLKVYATPERAAEAYATAAAKPLIPTYGPPLMLLRDGRTVAWWLPNGQNLRNIRVCFQPKLFRRLAKKIGACVTDQPLPTLMRYVPRRRALFRWTADGESVYLKFYGDKVHKQAGRNLALLNTLHREALGFRVPRLLAHKNRWRVVAMDELPGLPYTAIMAQADPMVAQRIGNALATLHMATLPLTATHTIAEELRALLAAMMEVKRALPTLAVSIDALVAQLHATCPADLEPVPIHGNLFGDQILVAPDAIGMVDWDDLTRGDPLQDVGRLAAHLIYRSLCGELEPARASQHLNALLNGYRERTQQPIDDARLRWHIAVALLIRAKISALRPLVRDWTDHINESLVAARLVLQGRWLP